MPFNLFRFYTREWYKELFETVLGKPVKVKIFNTILNGADECRFEIKF